MKMVFLIIWLIFILFGWVIPNPTDLITWLQLEISLILIGLWVLNQKYSKVLFDSVLVTLVMYYTWIGATDWAINYLPFHISFFESIFFCIVLFYQLYKRSDFKSDKISSKGIYLIFFKPKTFRQYLFSLFGSPFTSVGSIINGKVYRLKHSQNKMCVSKINKKYIQDNYTIVKVANKIDNIEKIEDELLEQSAYSSKRFGTRTNCIDSQKPLLDRLGSKWHTKGIFDFIPCVYINKRLKG